MKLIENWKEISLKAYSMWAQYLGLFLLLWAEFGYSILYINPFLAGWGGLALLVLGIAGRIIEQKSVRE